MDYKRKIVGDREWFKSELPASGTAISARVDWDFKRELDVLAETNGMAIGSVTRHLLYAGYEKYCEDMDRYADAQDDLSERLSQLGYDDIAVNALFAQHKDLSELNKLVVELEEKR